ncbi:MAG TPA: secretin N-terminal domain-containing protein [Pyrinomonadaceae bacterium]|nr:secretin N-terminal domain-containing protein [Pyrinomonadaceae bacterium]
MKSYALARRASALLLAAVMLASPAAVLAKKGEKNYNRGLEYERAQQWEKAAQEFALAVAALPSETEYLLHYRRAVFNASQNYMTKGRALADQGDYVGAYNAYRQAYGLDPVNDLAAQEMDRMLRLQREKEGAAAAPANGVRNAPTSFRPNGQPAGTVPVPDGQADGSGQPARVEQLQTVQYNGDLEGLIRKLADELSLNVVFDQNFSQVKRNINIKWRDITPARALDYVFLANGLFFQKLDRRTILVADQSKRGQYQQLVLRTFYLYNITPAEARTLLTGALPANAGRQPQFMENKTTNSITVRDTPENVRIIENLLRTVDKDRAEVVMEVAIYEISRNDLLQIGNQVGTSGSLQNLGGISAGSLLYRGTPALALGSSTVGLGSGLGLLIPSSTLSLFQSKTNTRLLFSTQVHAFDDEKSSTRVGSKVPVQTASVYNGLVNSGTNTGTGNGNQAGVGNVFGGSGYPVIQYEDVGLNLDFKPKVYPNQDVQVSMSIESKDVAAGPDPLTPTFSQRKIEGVARIPNGKTMMIASIAQDRETNGREGLPLVGLIPILGRLFTTPKKNNQNSDIVITMTPRVLRAPEITPADLEPKETGTMQTPQSPSLEAMVRDADREDQFAKLRSLPTNQTVQLQLPAQPGEEAMTFVPAPKALAQSALNDAAAAQPQTADGARAVNVSLATSFAAPAVPVLSGAAPVVNDAGTAPAMNNAASASPAVNNTTAPTVNNTAAPAAENKAAATSASVAPAESAAELLLMPEQQELKVGERRRVMVFMKTDAPVGLAAATLRFDPKALAVRSVTQGGLGGDKSQAPVVTQSVDPSGVLVLSVAPAAGSRPLTGEGLLVVIEVEGLAPGETGLQFDADKVHLIATDGRAVLPRTTPARLRVTQ